MPNHMVVRKYVLRRTIWGVADYLCYTETGGSAWGKCWQDAHRFWSKHSQSGCDNEATKFEMIPVVEVVEMTELTKSQIDEMLVAADFLEERGFRVAAEQLRLRAEQYKPFEAE